MDLSFGIGGSKGKSKTTQDPWAPQADLLKNFLYPEVKSLYGQTQAPGIDPFQSQAYGLGGSLLPLGLSTAQQFGQVGQSLSGGLGSAYNYLGSQLGANAQAPSFDWNLANQFANNPNVDGMISASLRDPARALMEQQMPGIESAAIATGNMGGSREAIAQGIAQRGFDDRAADVGAFFRDNAYGRGIDAAMNQQGMQFQQNLQNQQQQMAAAQGLGNLGTQGMGYLQNQYGMSQGAAQDLGGWGDYLQSLQYDQTRFPWELLNQASGIIQANNWGGTSSTRGSNIGFQAGFGYQSPR
jgi:hypothetical protein